MRGTILGVHEGQGTLLSADDRRLEFPLTEWRSAGTPSAGQVVDFVDEGGQARAVFAVPGAAAAGATTVSASGSMVLSSIGVACLALGFVIPLLPTIAAFVLGVIGAGQAQRENDSAALLLARIAWIGALVMLAIGVLAVLAVVTLIGTFGLAALWSTGLGPMDF